MLPKPEKGKKAIKTEQLDLVETIASDDRIKKKRRLLIAVLLFTIGLSFAFWAYRTTKRTITEIKRNPPRLTLPEVKIPRASSLSSLTDYSISNDLNSLLDQGSDAWIIFAKNTKPNINSKPISWTKNAAQTYTDSAVQSKVASIGKTISKSQSLIRSSLPDGVQVQEASVSAIDTCDYEAVLTVPDRQMFIGIKIISKDNLEGSKKLIPTVASKIYWYLIQQH